jgi:hypothetical protein
VFQASPAAVKNYLLVEGANHYYAGQPDLLAQVVSEACGWLQRNNLAT